MFSLKTLTSLSSAALLIVLASVASASDNWQERPPLVRPGFSAFYGGGAVYDAVEGRTILVGPEPSRIWKISLVGGLAWDLADVSGAPPATAYYQAAVLDSVHRRIIVPCRAAGGFTYDQLQLWALSIDEPRQWTQLALPDIAFNRWSFTCALDPVRNRLLLFGGYYRLTPTNTDATSQLLAYDLASDSGWTVVTTAGTRPGKRANMSSIYDRARDRMLLFAGETPQGFNGEQPLSMDDTWELSFATPTPTWTLLTPTSAVPPARERHVAIHDPAHDRMIVYGGDYYAVTSGERGDVWSLPLDTPGTAAWVNHGAGPGVRTSALGVFDRAAQRVLVLGGNTTLAAGQRLSRYDLWSWTLDQPGTWTNELGTADPIRNRANHSAIYDHGRDQMVAFFGSGFGETQGSNGHADAWAYAFASNSWRRLGELNRTIVGHAEIEDAPRNRLITFLGCPSGSCADDLYELDPVNGGFVALADAGTPPGATSGFAATFDPTGARMLVFGGATPGPAPFTTRYNDVWALALAGTPTWSHLTEAGTPPSPRIGSRVFFDRPSHRMLVVGGTDSIAILKDVWALSLDATPTWSPVTTTNSPSGTLTGVALDSLRHRLVAITQVGAGADTLVGWELPLDGVSTWSRLNPITPPPASRSGHSTIFDPLRDRLVLFGGSSPASPDGMNDVWGLGFDHSTPTLVSLFDWRFENGVVNLTWRSSEPGIDAVLYRRAPGDAWRAAGVLHANRDGEITWRDAEVQPGLRYGYRLGLLEEGREVLLGEIVIDVPSRLALALGDVRPNPVVDQLQITYALATRGAARLALVDAAGRRVLEQAIAGAPGVHQIRIDRARLPAPGLYFLRLEQGAASASKKIVVTR